MDRWRRGELDAASLLRRFDAWLAASTDPAQRKRLLSDRIAVAAQAGFTDQAIAYAGQQPLDALAAYAVLALVGAARAAGNADVQANAVRTLLALEPGGWDAGVQEALWLVDTRQLDQAQSAIESLSARAQAQVPQQRAMVCELRGALAEARGDKPQALLHYEEVLVLQPDHRYAGRATVLLTAELGAPGAALERAEAKPAAFSALEIAGLRQAALGERLRWGVSERDRLLPEDPSRFAGLDAVLRDSGPLAATFVSGQQAAPPREQEAWRALRRRLAADRVVASFERGLYAQAVVLYDGLLADFGEAPYYATAAAAGSQAQLRRPDLAVPLYEQALRDGASAVRMPSDIHVGLVYAYLDSGRFAQANALVEEMVARTPQLLNLSPERGRPNNDYGDVMGLRALVALYTDRPARAQREFEHLTGLAPMNTGYRVGLARTLRTRQHPQAALAAFDEVLTDDPRSVDARAGRAETLFDNGRLQEGREQVDLLAQQHPDHPAARSAVRTRDTVMSARLDVEAGTGRDGGTLSNRDSFAEVRLRSGWDSQQRRVFAHTWLGEADVGSDEPRHGRAGVGLEWRRGAWRWDAELHQSSSGARRTGIALGADWRASDAWLLGARLDTNSLDVPWRARAADISARDAQLQARYLVHESRNFSGTLGTRNYSDGNRRDAIGLAWQERWLSGPRFQLQTTLAADTARNSRQTGPYFSPGRESAAALTVRGQWLGWRRDDRSLLHVLEADAGRYTQAGFDGGATSQLRYAHEWTWGAGWRLRYGVGTSAHPYDGVRERRREAFIQFSMPLK